MSATISGRSLQRGIEDVAALAAGAGHDQYVHTLVDVAGHGGRTLARLVVGVGVDCHQTRKGFGHAVHCR